MTTELSPEQAQRVRDAPKGQIGSVAAELGIPVKRAYNIRSSHTPEASRPRHVVYRAFDVEEQLLYIGASDSFEDRKRAHLSLSGWAKDAAYWEIEDHPTRQAALDAEAEAIRSECPIHNVVGRPASEAKPFMGERYGDIEEYLVFVARVLRGAAERVGAADTHALVQFVALRDELEEDIAIAVGLLRNDLEYPTSWAEIGKALGLNRANAQRKYKKVGGARDWGHEEYIPSGRAEDGDDEDVPNHARPFHTHPWLTEQGKRGHAHPRGDRSHSHPNA
jgi:hypothetical protein